MTLYLCTMLGQGQKKAGLCKCTSKYKVEIFLIYLMYWTDDGTVYHVYLYVLYDKVTHSCDSVGWAETIWLWTYDGYYSYLIWQIGSWQVI